MGSQGRIRGTQRGPPPPEDCRQAGLAAVSSREHGLSSRSESLDVRRLLVVMGQPRFSERIGWDALAAHWPPGLADRIDIESVEPGGLGARILAGPRQPDVVVPIMSPVSRETILAGTFGLVQQFGAGVEAIDIEAATAEGVWVANMAGLNAVAVAEHAIALLLALMHRLPEAPRGFESGHWGEPAGRSLAGSTVCVVGLGAIGTALAERLAAWGVTVIGVHRRPTPDPAASRACARTFRVNRLSEALSAADAVIIAASHDPRRPPVMDRAALAALPAGAYLVNVARAGLLDHGALLRALDSDRLAGAALDVFPTEPCSDEDPLVRHPRILATAHIAAATADFFEAGATRLGDAMIQFLAGRPPRDLINTELVATRWPSGA